MVYHRLQGGGRGPAIVAHGLHHLIGIAVLVGEQFARPRDNALGSAFRKIGRKTFRNCVADDSLEEHGRKRRA